MPNDVVKRLFELSDEKYRDFHSKLCPTKGAIIGVRMPKMRDFAAEIAKGDWRKYLADAGDEFYEETLLQGLVIGAAKVDVDEKLAYLAAFVPKIDNWATCDCTCAGLKFVKKNLEKVWDFLQLYTKSNEEFSIRFSIVTMLDYYVNTDYLPQLFAVFDNVNHEGYYVKMAVAWAISVCFVEFPSETFSYFSVCKLDDFTFNKSLQKIVESFRVTDENKAKIRSLKR
ncbi:MAG: DNA alkylation repair protein [Oscillospiraceae bacterium]